jgi:tyrosine-protein phosphatase SIW14
MVVTMFQTACQRSFRHHIRNGKTLAAPVCRFVKRVPGIARAACVVVVSVTMLAASVSAQGPAQTNPKSNQPAAAHAFAKKIALKGVPALEQVAPNLYRGNQPSAEGFQNLAKMGIQIVVDMRLSKIGSERKRVTKLGMQYVSIPWFCMFPSDKKFAEFLQLIRDNPDKKIFVHCRLGDDRAGMTIAVYRMAEQGWTAQEARKEMIESGADFLHRRLCPTLAYYERKFPERFQTKPAFEKLRGLGPLPEAAVPEQPEQAPQP